METAARDIRETAECHMEAFKMRPGSTVAALETQAELMDLWWVPGRVERGDEGETDRSRSMSARPKLPFFEWVHATRPGTRALLRRGLATAERGRSIIFRLKRGRRATSQIR